MFSEKMLVSKTCKLNYPFTKHVFEILAAPRVFEFLKFLSADVYGSSRRHSISSKPMKRIGKNINTFWLRVSVIKIMLTHTAHRSWTPHAFGMRTSLVSIWITFTKNPEILLHTWSRIHQNQSYLKKIKVARKKLVN